MQIKSKHSLAKTGLTIFWTVALALIVLVISRSYGTLWEAFLGADYYRITDHITNFAYSCLCVWVIGTALYMLWQSWKGIILLAACMGILNLVSEGVLSHVHSFDGWDALSGVCGVLVALIALRYWLLPRVISASRQNTRA